MLRTAGQTTGPIGLKFFVDTYGRQGGVKGYKKIQKKISNFFSTVQAVHNTHAIKQVSRKNQRVKVKLLLLIRNH